MAGPEWKLDSGNKTVTATFPTNPPTTLTLSTTDVDAVLKNLGSLRGDMQPEVPDEASPDQGEEPIADPAWEVLPPESGDGAILGLRDPRFGWLHYAIPKEEAQKMGGFLQEG